MENKCTFFAYVSRVGTNSCVRSEAFFHLDTLLLMMNLCVVVMMMMLIELSIGNSPSSSGQLQGMPPTDQQWIYAMMLPSAVATRKRTPLAPEPADVQPFIRFRRRHMSSAAARDDDDGGGIQQSMLFP